MSDETQETIADIVSEMRNEGHTGYSSCLGWVGVKMQRYADRIESAANHHFRKTTKMMTHEEVAAAKMETAAPTSEKSSVVGDAQAMREAVKTALDELLLWNYTDRDTARMALGVVNTLNAALSTPPRNCDVGTTEEQERRYEKLCDSHTCGSSGSDCPLYDYDCSQLAWAQMPYEEA